MKKPVKNNKKSDLEKTLLDSHDLDIKGSIYQDYDFGWGIDGNSYTYSDIYDYGFTYSKDPKDVYMIQQEEASKVKAEWAGALVRFNTRYYNRGITSVFSGAPSTIIDTGGSNTSRLSDEDYDYLKHTGTVISVATNSNYKSQWCATIMWSDGMLSYENVLDLQIIQPGN